MSTSYRYPCPKILRTLPDFETCDYHAGADARDYKSKSDYMHAIKQPNIPSYLYCLLMYNIFVHLLRIT